jgi:uncharacterized protein (TIGR03118 family)
MRRFLRRLQHAWQSCLSERPRGRYRPALEGLEDRHLLANGFVETNLVSDIPGLALITDPRLINPWGVALSPTTGAFWVSDAGSGVATLYMGDVNGSPFVRNPLVVTVPPAPGGTQGQPSGQVFNSTSDFVVRSGAASGPALFIFAGLDGTISGWNPGVPAGGTSTQAELEAAVPGAVYTGLAIGSNGSGNFLYAANVAGGRIDVFDKNFARTRLAGSFTDPSLPAGFTPFNIRSMNGVLFVAYQNGRDRDHGGVVDTFDMNGNFLRRIATGGPLNAPWGLVMAPANFGPFSNDLLVGNFGDGRISAFDPATGAFLGQLTGTNGQPLVFERLWRLTFGNGVTAGDSNTLYFTAGINNEKDGLFGSLRPDVSNPPGTANQRFLSQVYLDLLHRPIDPTGLATWSGLLAQGVPRTQIVLTIEASMEFRTVVVQGLYNTFLHRAADDGGLKAFTDFLARGGTIEQVEESITSSPEYFQNRGGGTNDGFLDALYQDALNRSVDPFGRSVFDQALAHGATRAEVATAIFTSNEFLQDLVDSFFQRFLRRAPDNAGLATFTGLLRQGARDEQVIAFIVGSEEYFQRF